MCITLYKINSIIRINIWMKTKISFFPNLYSFSSYKYNTIHYINYFMRNNKKIKTKNKFFLHIMFGYLLWKYENNLEFRKFFFCNMPYTFKFILFILFVYLCEYIYSFCIEYCTTILCCIFYRLFTNWKVIFT